MTTADGRVVSTTRIVDSGPANQRWNLVVLGDGYQEAQLGQYAADVQRFIDALLATSPFDELRPGINVFRVDVASTDAGADDPIACGGSGTAARTYFDASFCNNGIRRLLLVDNLTAITTASSAVPEWTLAMVLVNSPVYGGAGGAVATFSLASGAEEIGIHEAGHTAFGLADEYEYYQGCGVDTDRDRHPAAEPAEPNVTINTDTATLKWGHLVEAGTPVPTTRNADCTVCDPQGNPQPVGTVGLYEGAHYYHCDSYRPEFNCKMRALGQSFCAVCRQQIRVVLGPYQPTAPVVARHSGLVLDIAGSSLAPRAGLIQWPHHGGGNQQFRLEALADGSYRVLVGHSGQVLDVEAASKTAGAQIIQWPWHGGDNQRFALEHVETGTWRLVARHSGLVLDIRGASTAQGADVIQWPWHGGNNQRFRL
jgi:hypothetical protein